MQEGIRAAEFPFSQTDDSRSENASGYGGFELTDDDLLGRHRSVISEMVSVSALVIGLLKFLFIASRCPLSGIKLLWMRQHNDNRFH